MTTYLEAAEDLRPNERQWEAYTSTGNCVVLAGPGSGKTKILTVKMAQVLAEEVQRPHGIACVTYNNECVRELRRRLDTLSVEETDRVFVGTLHGFCLRHVLAPIAHLTDTPLPSKLRVASDSQVLEAVGGALVSLNQGATPNDARNDIDRHRRLALDRSTGQRWVPGTPLTDLCTKYEELLFAAGYVDFEAIIGTSLRLIEGLDFVRDCIRAKFPVLFVDEYQDLGEALDRVVQALCFDAGVRLFAVGDPDQSVYGFTGAKPELLKTLAERPEVQAVRLRLNYRSGRSIVRASEVALGEMREYEPSRDAEGIVNFYQVGHSVEDEVEFAVSELLPDVLTRHSPGNVVVLHPTAWEGDILERNLGVNQMAFVRLGRNGSYPKTPVTRLLEECAEWEVKSDSPVLLSRLLGRWSSLIDDHGDRANRIALARFLFRHRGNAKMAARDWLADFESTVVLPNGAQQRLIDAGYADGLEKLFAATAKGGRIEDFTLANLGGQLGSPDHLNLLTLHSSKGCEFNAVLIIGADEGRLPNFRALNSAPRIEEARRLFYVGVSRARDEVHILCSSAAPGDRYQQGPSRFVKELRAAMEGS
jgi:DNA helicase-2/ATP-dependent DNA helicase PcrA